MKSNFDTSKYSKELKRADEVLGKAYKSLIVDHTLN